MKPAWCLTCLILGVVLFADIATAQDDSRKNSSSGYSSVASRMKELLSRGAAVDAVKLAASALGQEDDQDPGRSDVIFLQAQGYLKLGMPQVATRLLRERISGLNPESGSELQALYGLLSQSAILSGRLDEAEQTLDKASQLSTKLPAQSRFWALMLKAHIRYRQKRNADAMKLCREAESEADATGISSQKAFALIQRAQIAKQTGDTAQAAKAYQDVLDGTQQKGDSSDSVSIILTAASGLSRLTAGNPAERKNNISRAEKAFEYAVDCSSRLSDVRSLSQSYGKWGMLLEEEGRLDEALSKTLLALHQAQQARLYDLQYQWQHRTGRILKTQGQNTRALDLFRAAVQNLNHFKKGLSSDCGIADGSFQEMTKPIYLDLAELLIDMSGQSKDRDEEQRYLLEARSAVETLRTEELRDYFEDACLGSEKLDRAALATVPPKTALIYTIMFPQRLEMLVSLPDGIKRFKAAESSVTVSREVRLLRLTIENRFPAWTASARKLYDWLLRPLESEFNRQGISTIVFVPDGPLRNVPLTVLHDGTRSLIEKYAVATIQGIGFASVPRSEGAGQRVMLMAGLSESVQGYPALVNVTEEVKGIRTSYPGASLINSDFRVQNVKEQLDQMPYPLIHIASHGEFTGNSRNNYILTWDGKMTLDDLDRFIRNSAIRKTPVELLSLSACKTAAGDDRASLGLAGLAVKSGARTAVASLWDIDDKSTSELFVEFYRIIRDGKDINRAEALRQAQLTIKKRYDHPYFWSPFLLIGNWL